MPRRSPPRSTASTASAAPAGDAAAPPPRDPRLERATVEHYLDPVLYDHEYRRRRADVSYYRRLARDRLSDQPAGEREVLELGCGSGRLMVPLLRDGHAVTGVDSSRPMLRRCEERIARLPPPAQRRGRLLQHDFRSLRLGRRFPLLICPFNAMMHLYSRDDVERFLGVVREHVLPGGQFAFDVMNPDIEWLARDPDRRWARTRFKDPHDGRTLFYSTNHVYDRVSQINWIRLYYDEDGGGISPRGSARASPRGAGPRDLTSSETPSPTRSRVVLLAQRQLFPEELLDILHYNGFVLEAREGGFAGEPFDGESHSQVCRCSIRSAARR